MNTRQVSLIANYAARYSVRGGVGLVFVLISLTFGLIVAHMLLQPVEMITRKVAAEAPAGADQAEIRDDIMHEFVQQAQPVVSWFLAAPGATGDPDAEAAADEWADFLLFDHPAALSAIFLILLFGWPLIVAIGAFDLYAGDIASRQLRYQLLRADRSSIFFGRLLGSVFTFVFVLGLLGLTVCLYMGFKLPAYGWADLISWSIYGTLALIVLSLPYMALSSWISASCTSSFGSLTFISLIIGGVPLLAKLGGISHEAVGYVIYVLPWGFQTHLFHPSSLNVVFAALGCLAMTVLFGYLGWRKFTTRDL